MDPSYHLILENTDLQQAAELNSTRNVPVTPVSSTNKTDSHDIIEILLKVTLNTITMTPKSFVIIYFT
jgi:predicted CoA-binding protein